MPYINPKYVNFYASGCHPARLLFQIESFAFNIFPFYLLKKSMSWQVLLIFCCLTVPVTNKDEKSSTIPTTEEPATTSKMSWKEKVGRKIGEKLTGYLFLKGSRRAKVDLALEPKQYHLLGGIDVTLKCPKANRNITVDWFIGGFPLDPTGHHRMDRPKFHQLHINPLLSIDSGRIECYQKDKFLGQISLTVLSIEEAFRLGFRNYAICMPIVSILFVILIIYSENTRGREPIPKDEDPDQIDADFQNKELELHDTEQKDTVAELSKMEGPAPVIVETRIPAKTILQTLFVMQRQEREVRSKRNMLITERTVRAGGRTQLVTKRFIAKGKTQYQV